jgi:hypothetical protein
LKQQLERADKDKETSLQQWESHKTKLSDVRERNTFLESAIVERTAMCDSLADEKTACLQHVDTQIKALSDRRYELATLFACTDTPYTPEHIPWNFLQPDAESRWNQTW